MREPDIETDSEMDAREAVERERRRAETVERALDFVEEFADDPRCALSRHYVEALAAEVHRLRDGIAMLRLTTDARIAALEERIDRGRPRS